MEKQWYVVNTYSGHENKVKEKLEMRAESMDMKDSSGSHTFTFCFSSVFRGTIILLHFISLLFLFYPTCCE